MIVLLKEQLDHGRVVTVHVDDRENCPQHPPQSFGNGKSSQMNYTHTGCHTHTGCQCPMESDMDISLHTNTCRR